MEVLLTGNAQQYPLEQRSDINVRRSWLSWLPETVGLTYTPEQFDPHGAGYTASSRSSISRGSVGDGYSSLPRNTGRPATRDSRVPRPPSNPRSASMDRAPPISTEGEKEKEKSSVYEEPQVVQPLFSFDIGYQQPAHSCFDAASPTLRMRPYSPGVSKQRQRHITPSINLDVLRRKSAVVYYNEPYLPLPLRLYSRGISMSLPGSMPIFI